MDVEAGKNKEEAQGPRKSSPHANEFYGRKIITGNDPDGLREARINRYAKRLARLDPVKDAAIILSLREKLTREVLLLFHIEDANASLAGNADICEDNYSQIDDLLLETIVKVLDSCDPQKYLFTHMLRKYYVFARKEAARKAVLEDTVFGGETGYLQSLQEDIRQADGSLTALGDSISSEAAGYAPIEEEAIDELNLDKALKAAGETRESGLMNDDFAEEEILVKLISLIAEFLGKSGKAANETRKLYTKMFFTETLTKLVKLRVEGELGGFERQEKGLFGSVEIPFQDTYTINPCRTIAELWRIGFADGIRAVESISWTIPAAFYIAYLKSLGRPASNALVSQQRSNYEKLLLTLKR